MIRGQRPVYDVCIVGSGAGGGMAAYQLANAGVNVVMLEAGPEWYATEDSAMFTWSYESPRRGAATPERPFGEWDACDGGWEIEGEPYTTAPGTEFRWWRARMLGGRTNHWGRISLRFGPDDFRRGDLDGLSPNWPITYDDIKPYYDRVDRLVGIFGSIENLPNEPDGIFMPPPRPRCYELLVKRACDNLDITCIPSRLSIITQALGNRPPCHYCGQCNRGCTANANFSSPSVLIAPALDTGNLTLLTNAMVREVTVDSAGLANGVSYIDKNTGQDEHIQARVVVLAASACSSARILLNSKSSQFPNGLANSSGTVGKWLTDTTGASVSGFIPQMVDHVPHNEDGVGGMHVYMPWWLDNSQLDFPRGYHIEVWGGLGMPGYGFMGGIHRYPGAGGYGQGLKRDYRRFYGATVGFSGRGEMIPNENSFCELDPEVTDRWGIPVLRFHWQFTDHEFNQVRHMHETFRGIIDEMGGEVWSPMPSRERGYGIAAGGTIIHELGGTRMGDDPS
ncbi:MAG TPA: GMC family oxidoreductase, partial [Longimicrobiales bacterium]|nr:GMC family oxidoreductase [Longimicrobiales bacterium]